MLRDLEIGVQFLFLLSFTVINIDSSEISVVDSAVEHKLSSLSNWKSLPKIYPSVLSLMVSVSKGSSDAYRDEIIASYSQRTTGYHYT